MALKIFAAPSITLPEDVYSAKVVDIVEIDNQFYKEGDPEHKEKAFEWIFETVYEDDDGEKKTVNLRRRTGRTTSTKGNLYKFVRGITGKAPTANSDLSSIIGKECRVVIKNVERDGRIYSNIADVMTADKQAKESSEDVRGEEDASEDEEWLEPSA